MKGVLIVNLGTPNSFQNKDVFRYLIEFLTDQRVIDMPWIKRQLLIRGLIVPLRYKQSAKQYEQIWTKQGSPLLVHSQKVKKQLQNALGDHYFVSLAMRYQYPSIKGALSEFKERNINELTIIPLFPQFASATTGSVFEKIMHEIKKWKTFPEIRFINHYFDHPKIVEAFSERGKQYAIETYDHILFSFHGLPEKHLHSIHNDCEGYSCKKEITSKNNACYRAQCYATARSIAYHLKLDPQKFSVCFQSRLGKEPWLQPYTSEIIKKCAQRGDKRLLVFSPSFVCDCLETLYEISIEYQKEFKKCGGEELQLVEGLNDHPLWIEALKELVCRL